VVALSKFSARFESTPVTGTTTATLVGNTFAHAWKPDDGQQDIRAEARMAGCSRERRDRAGRNRRAVGHAAKPRAIPLKEPLSSGYRITRTITPIQQKAKDQWQRGDVARVTLTVEAQSDMTWVVVDDPLPAGRDRAGSRTGRRFEHCDDR
jgi:hypothetical protein